MLQYEKTIVGHYALLPELKGKNCSSSILGGGGAEFIKIMDFSYSINRRAAKLGFLWSGVHPVPLKPKQQYYCCGVLQLVEYPFLHIVTAIRYI
jgi:hypothetical protein